MRSSTNIIAAPPVLGRSLTVLGRIAAAARRCRAYSKARISEWQCRVRYRRELLMLSEREMRDVGLDIRLDRYAAEIGARKPF